MPLFNEKDLRLRLKKDLPLLTESQIMTRAIETFQKEAAIFDMTKKYDIFLSHSFKDADLIKSLRDELVEMKYSVYVDWIEDADLDRSNVTTATAKRIKDRMKSCKCLFFVATHSAQLSKWAPWELGFMDAYSKKVAILPIVSQPTMDENYKGSEYLGIYPWIRKSIDSKSLVIHNSLDKVDLYSTWINN